MVKISGDYGHEEVHLRIISIYTKKYMANNADD